MTVEFRMTKISWLRAVNLLVNFEVVKDRKLAAQYVRFQWPEYRKGIDKKEFEEFVEKILNRQ